MYASSSYFNMCIILYGIKADANVNKSRIVGGGGGGGVGVGGGFVYVLGGYANFFR